VQTLSLVLLSNFSNKLILCAPKPARTQSPKTLGVTLEQQTETKLMSALGELIIYVVYFMLGLHCIIFIVLTITSKKSTKPWTLLASLMFVFLFFNFKSCQDNNYKRNQLSVVGVYYLTNYPNCDSCYLELKENMSYVIVNEGKVIEQSNWHYEVGGDYWIIYLDNDRHQLGSGEYFYERYKLKHSNDPKQ